MSNKKSKGNSGSREYPREPGGKAGPWDANHGPMYITKLSRDSTPSPGSKWNSGSVRQQFHHATNIFFPLIQKYI